jgi:hypothetical protein
MSKMGTPDFLDLHDATLTQVTCDWGEGTCTAVFRRWNPTTRQPQFVELRWEGVTDLVIPRAQPWGPSASVNTTTFDGAKVHEIEMQSGDRIKVTAERMAVIDAGAA